jgi:hypothetical protein
MQPGRNDVLSCHRFPLESSALAPGMCAEVDVCFTPDSLGDYEDSFSVESPAGRFEVQLTGRRPHPDLTLPSVLEVSPQRHRQGSTQGSDPLCVEHHLAWICRADTAIAAV